MHQGWLTIAPFVASGMITLGKYGPLIKAEKELAGKMRRTLTHAKTKLLESSGELAETLKQSLTTELFGSEANEADKEDEARDKVPVEDEATDDSSDANLDGVVLGEAIRTYANRVLVCKSPELCGLAELRCRREHVPVHALVLPRAAHRADDQDLRAEEPICTARIVVEDNVGHGHGAERGSQERRVRPFHEVKAHHEHSEVPFTL